MMHNDCKNLTQANMENIKISKFWNTPDLNEGDDVIVRRLGESTPGEFRGKIRGIFGCDTAGSPDCYIVEMIDKLPNQKYSCIVFPRGCVDSLLDITLKDERLLA